MDGIEPRELREAQEIFRELLKRDSKEREFQDFFAQHPYVLTPSLPLRLEPKDVVPMGRPGNTEPDFIFYPHDADTVDFYGVIELKRPGQRIATITRSNTAILTRDAQSAVAQAQQYIEVVPDLIQTPLSSGHLFLGNDRYLFVIMGLTTQEKIFDTTHRTFLQSIQNQLRPFGNLHILPYDFLLNNFEKRIYRYLYILVPKPTAPGPIRLRSQPILNFSHNDASATIQAKGFYDQYLNWVGTGLKHEYDLIDHASRVFLPNTYSTKLVVDRTTNLMWQQGGSEQVGWFNSPLNYIQSLNNLMDSGYRDWRLPTLEEAMSLMEPTKHGDIYIDSVFDRKQSWIWTADTALRDRPWCVNFEQGFCNVLGLEFDIDYCIRAVRSG